MKCLKAWIPNSLYRCVMKAEKDEIGSMVRSYNRMAARTNELIQTVYKNKLVEQEMLVSRKNAELLAFHSQINPHFLFNALEHPHARILKNEK